MGTTWNQHRYALIGAAREVGMAANEFASTDLGKVVTFVVVYKIIGESLVGVGFGLIVFYRDWETDRKSVG